MTRRCPTPPGGVSPAERGLVWRFLFGTYPYSSTPSERSLLLEQNAVRYLVMKRKWQRFLPSSVRIHLNGSDGDARTWRSRCFCSRRSAFCFLKPAWPCGSDPL